jgi:hypothetical protein
MMRGCRRWRSTTSMAWPASALSAAAGQHRRPAQHRRQGRSFMGQHRRESVLAWFAASASRRASWPVQGARIGMRRRSERSRHASGRPAASLSRTVRSRAARLVADSLQSGVPRSGARSQPALVRDVQTSRAPRPTRSGLGRQPRQHRCGADPPLGIEETDSLRRESTSAATARPEAATRRRPRASGVRVASSTSGETGSTSAVAPASSPRIGRIAVSAGDVQHLHRERGSASSTAHLVAVHHWERDVDTTCGRPTAACPRPPPVGA